MHGDVGLSRLVGACAVSEDEFFVLYIVSLNAGALMRKSSVHLCPRVFFASWDYVHIAPRKKKQAKRRKKIEVERQV